MDHIVYLDYKAKELQNLSEGSKNMIIRGAMGRKMPYGRVFEGDQLYFVENNGKGLILAKARVKNIVQTDKLTKEESTALVEKYQKQLILNNALKKRFAGKRYLILIELSGFEAISPFSFDRSEYGNMDDWLPVENIDRVKAE